MPSASSSVKRSGSERPATASSSSKSLSSSGGHGSSSHGSKKRREGDLTALEKRVWQTIYASEDHSMLSPDYSARFADVSDSDRHDTINSLSRKSLLTFQKTSSGVLLMVAASKKEASIMGSLTDDEAIVYAHVRDAKNDGIWTKILKNKCNLHQTIITRTLKSLEGKGLIKAVKSVKNPTRKIYMLTQLQPSVELSGGPWYTDHELDTTFIDQLCRLLDIYICQETWPDSKGRRERPSSPQPILLASSTSQLPNATACLRWLKSKKVTDTKLQVQDVQSLLDVLVYDGKVEKIPQFGLTNSRRSKQRGRGSDDEYDDRRHRDGYETVSDESEIEVGSSRARNGTRRAEEEGSESDFSQSGDERSRRKGKTKSGRTSTKKRRRRDSGESGSDDSDESSQQRKKKSIRLSSEEASDSSGDSDSDADDEGAEKDNYVYRAIRPLQTHSGWTEVPCAHCPVINFCQPGGPINAESCIYMRDWLVRTKKRDEEERQEQEGSRKVKVALDRNGHLSSYDDGLGSDNYVADDMPDEPNGQDEYDEDYGGEEV